MLKAYVKEFKEFALKGNVLDMAVGVIIGTAFSKIVSSLVSDIIMPLFAGILGSHSFVDLKLLLVDKGEESVYLLYGQFIQNIVDFLIVALSIFVFLKIVNSLGKKRKKEEAAPAPAAKSDEVVLLEEIRDLLKQR